MGKLGFYFNQRACAGCRVCQIACKDRNNLDVGIIYRKVRTFETGTYPDAQKYQYSGSCNHCENAKCVQGCPTGAMHYANDGTVQHDKVKCVGCKYCVWNCPYGVPQFNEVTGIVGKCDSCKELRDKGQNPVCVDACLMRCLEFGDLDELAEKHKNVVQDLPILPSSTITKPSVLISPKNCALNPSFKEKEV